MGHRRRLSIARIQSLSPLKATYSHDGCRVQALPTSPPTVIGDLGRAEDRDPYCAGGGSNRGRLVAFRLISGYAGVTPLALGGGSIGDLMEVLIEL